MTWDSGRTRTATAVVGQEPHSRSFRSYREDVNRNKRMHVAIDALIQILEASSEDADT